MRLTILFLQLDQSVTTGTLLVVGIYSLGTSNCFRNDLKYTESWVNSWQSVVKFWFNWRYNVSILLRIIRKNRKAWVTLWEIVCIPSLIHSFLKPGLSWKILSFTNLLKRKHLKTFVLEITVFSNQSNL